MPSQVGLLFLGVVCVAGLAWAGLTVFPLKLVDPEESGDCSKLERDTRLDKKYGGNCRRFICDYRIGHVVSGGKIKFLQQVSANVYADPEAVKRPGKRRTQVFRFMGRNLTFEYSVGDQPIRPQTFRVASIDHCDIYKEFPSDCLLRHDTSLPYPACCAELECLGRLGGMIQVRG